LKWTFHESDYEFSAAHASDRPASRLYFH